MKNNKLAIAIPTYNRSEILYQNLIFMLPDIRIHNIPIYISDDSTDTKTEEMINQLKKDYPHIYYFKNSPALGHDKNCFFTLQLPSEEYVWYLGDSLSIEHNAISKILIRIESEDYSFVAVSSIGRNINLPSKYYTDAHEVFKELAWHLTLTGATIYNRNILSDLMNCTQSNYKNFPQIYIIFNKLLTCQNGLLWIEDKFIFPAKDRTSYWEKKVFEVFANDWSKVILSLPKNYSKRDKFFVIKSHDKYTGIFSPKNLVRYRLQKVLSWKVYLQYFYSIRLSINLNIFLTCLIVLTPISVIKKLKRYITW